MKHVNKLASVFLVDEFDIEMDEGRYHFPCLS